MNDIYRECKSIISLVIKAFIEEVGAISTVEGYLTHNNQIKGLNPAISTGSEKMPKRMIDGQKYCISIIKFVIKAFMEEVGAISTVEGYMTCNPQIGGSNPTIGTVKEKMPKRINNV